MIRPSTSFYQQDTALVARQLLGHKIVRQWQGERLEGYIVETEAYLPANDPACHASKGKTKRNNTMFGRGGLLYVYSIHSRYCMNIVTDEEGKGAAVLIRALEPTSGHTQLNSNRSLRRPDKPLQSETELTNGPGKLCDALGISIIDDGTDLSTSESIWIETGISISDSFITRTGRIGIREGAEMPLRFFVDGNKYVSGRASDHTRKRKDSLLDPLATKLGSAQ